MRWWQKTLLALAVATGLLAAYGYAGLRTLEVERLSDDLWVLRGVGGNTAVLRTDAGAVVVDTMLLPLQGDRIRQRARELTGKDTVLVINTHYHLDHTHGNPAFAPGTRVLSTERTLHHLKALDGDFWSGAAARLLPNETFSDRRTLEVGGKTLELVHPGRGHTDGDLVVVFRDEGFVHLGDLMFNRLYPNIDLEAGGSVQAWPQTLERVLALDFRGVIPGHGATTDREGLGRFRNFMAQLAAVGQTAAEQGLSLEETLASADLTADAGYDRVHLLFLPLPMDREFVITRAWEEVSDNYSRLD